MLRHLCGLGVLSFIVSVCAAQTQTNIPPLPTDEEVFALVNKADEKVTDFEAVIKASSPAVDADTIKTDLAAASTAHQLAAAIRKNGPSAYGLVSFMATLDDLSLDASRAALLALMTSSRNASSGHSIDQGALLSMVGLADSEKALYDISELVMHTTLRYVQTEEGILHAAFDKTAK